MTGVLSKSEVEALKTKKRSSTSKSYALLADGTKVAFNSNVNPGAFVGKAGTVRRSRKGRSFRAPNGRRNYQRNWECPRILAYLVKP